MKKSTIIRKMNEKVINKNILEEASSILKQGGTVVFPTETVYGLGANALDEASASKIYEIKGRPSDNPLIIHIATLESLNKIADNICDQAKELIEAFWPGSLTLIFNKKEDVPFTTTGGLNTVAVRMPNHTVALELIKYSGILLAAPSANTSGRPSPTLAEHVIEDLDGKVDMIVDGGKVELGLESTILDMTVYPPMLLRPGFISREMIEDVIGEIQVDDILQRKDKEVSEAYKPKSPGMKYRHYAPKANITIYEGSIVDVVEVINKKIIDCENHNMKVGVIATMETKEQYIGGNVKVLGSRSKEEELANNLFEVFRELDKENVDIIYSEAFNTEKLGFAIMNRLLKAASYNIIHL